MFSRNCKDRKDLCNDVYICIHITLDICIYIYIYIHFTFVGHVDQCVCVMMYTYVYNIRYSSILPVLPDELLI